MKLTKIQTPLVFTLFLSGLLMLSCQTSVQQKTEVEPAKENWKTEVEKTLKSYGHRNWIVIADSAYPKQSNPAIKTITIGPKA